VVIWLARRSSFNWGQWGFCTTWGPGSARRRRVGASSRAQPPRDTAVAGVSEPRVVQNPHV